MRRLLKLLSGNHPALLALGSLSSVLCALLSVVVIAFIERRLLRGAQTALEAGVQLAALLAALFVVTTGTQLLLRGLGHEGVRALRSDLALRVLGSDVVQLERTGPAKLLASLTSDATQVGQALAALPNVLCGAAISIASLVYLCWLCPRLFGAVAVCVAVTVALAGCLLAQSERWYGRVRDVEDGLQEHHQAIVFGRRELALNRMRAHLVYGEDLQPNLARSGRYAWRADALGALNDSLVTVMTLGTIGASFILAELTGWASREVAVTFGLTLLFVGTPLSSLVMALPQLAAGGVALRKIDALELPASSARPIAPSASAPMFQEIELRRVCYRYEEPPLGTGFTLGPIDLTVRRGELLFLVGGNGSGKSTLARILCGLTAPSAGSVLVDGAPVGGQSAVLRGLWSAVFSDYHLFDQLLGPRGEPDEALLHSLSERLALKSQLRVERGRLRERRLSSGQRKRLALLLALLEQRPLLLLDEWAADQDPGLRRVFYREVLPQLRASGTTVVAITHDEQYFGVADRVLRIEEGQLQRHLIGGELMTSPHHEGAVVPGARG